SLRRPRLGKRSSAQRRFYAPLLRRPERTAPERSPIAFPQGHAHPPRRSSAKTSGDWAPRTGDNFRATRGRAANKLRGAPPRLRSRAEETGLYRLPSAALGLRSLSAIACQATAADPPPERSVAVPAPPGSLRWNAPWPPPVRRGGRGFLLDAALRVGG